MIEINPTIEIQGVKFSPKRVNDITQTNFVVQNEVGELGVSGRYKDKPMPFGYASIQYGSKEIDSLKTDSIAVLLRYLLPRISIIRECGGDHIELNVAYTFVNQCNEEISIESLRLLALMEIPFTFSVYRK